MGSHPSEEMRDLLVAHVICHRGAELQVEEVTTKGLRWPQSWTISPSKASVSQPPPVSIRLAPAGWKPEGGRLIG